MSEQTNSDAAQILMDKYVSLIYNIWVTGHLTETYENSTINGRTACYESRNSIIVCIFHEVFGYVMKSLF